jgi:hypothetical protein
LAAAHVAPTATFATHAPAEQYVLEAWQSTSVAHAVRQVVAFAHLKPPAHAAVEPLPHVPVPLHVAAVVSSPLAHEAAPHGVVGDACSHVPPAPHLPSLPQVVVTAHCPAGAVVPAVMLPHVPLATPVSANAQAWHVPLHAELQQIPPTQLPCAHCPFEAHACPSGRSTHTFPWHTPLAQSLATRHARPVAHVLPSASHTAPPQSLSVSLPSFTPSLHETQVPGLLPEQRLFAQSALAAQCRASAHGGHTPPPQSLSVSLPFFTRSAHVGGWQSVPEHTPLTQSPATAQCCCGEVSLHVAPHVPPQSTSVSPASLVPSVQWVATHVPLPSQTTPPPSVHAVPFAALVVPHACAVHAAILQAVVGAGQSVVTMQATHAPVPSQSLPPLSVHATPADAGVDEHVLLAHAFTLQAVGWDAQSVATVQPTHLPAPSQTVPPVVQAKPLTALLVPQTPPVHVGETHSLEGFGQSAGEPQPVSPSATASTSGVESGDALSRLASPVGIFDSSNETRSEQPNAVSALPAIKKSMAGARRESVRMGTETSNLGQGRGRTFHARVRRGELMRRAIRSEERSRGGSANPRRAPPTAQSR